MRSTLLTAAALAGCNLPTTTLDPSAVVTGIYELTATPKSDTCDPPRFVGNAAVPLFADTDTIAIADENSDVAAPTIARYTLESSTGWTAQVPATGATFAPCPSGGSFSLALTLSTASASELDVDEDESWTIATACPGTTIDATSVPSASCAATRTLHYVLVQACATPCTIIETDLVPSCSCPQGSGAAL